MTAKEFNHYILSFQDQLKYFALSLTSNHDDANDLFQETYLKALVNREKLSNHDNLKAWLYTIMRNIFINNYRRTFKSNVKIEKTEEPFCAGLPESENMINGDAEFSYNEIESVIDRLQPELRETFRMYVAGYKYKEIAEEQDIVIGTVKSRIFNARQRLMTDLKDYLN